MFRDVNTGRILTKDGKLEVCDCCGCRKYFKATLCNTGDCIGWVYEAFICTNYRCEDEYGGTSPLENGQIIGGAASNGRTYCFTVNTETEYCEGGGKDCDPLPKGANILDPDDVECLDECDCEPLEGYYVAVPCSCNDEDLPGTVYVRCDAYLESLGEVDCPTWSLVIEEQVYCVQVLAGSTPTELPNPLGPHDQVITTSTELSNCCQCCGPREGCCYWAYLNNTFIYHPDCTEEYITGPVSYCCGTTESWDINYSGTYLVEQLIGGILCPMYFYEWSGNSVSYNLRSVTYVGDCSGVVADETFPYPGRGPCDTGWFGIEPPLLGCGPGEGTTQSGSIFRSCSGGTANVVVDNTAGGGLKSSYIAEYTVTSSPGDCGENGCDEGETDAAPRAMGIAQPRKGCGGCRRKRKAG